MKKIRILIVSIAVLIIIICVLLLVFNKNNSSNDNELYDNNNEVVSEKSEDNRSDITTTNYYTIQKCISQYLGVINKNNPAYYRIDENGNNVKYVEDDYIKERIYDLLSQNYINKNNITKNNIYSFVDDISETVNFSMLDAKVVKNNKSNQYIVYGFIQNSDNKFIKNKYYIINVDEINNVFSVEPISEEYNSMDEISVEDVEVEKNENNKIQTLKINSETQCKNYLTEFKRIMLSNPKIAYEYLDKEYRNNRFGSLAAFRKYLENNKDELKSISVSEYLVNVYDNYTEFVCKDKYGRIYTFEAETPLKYTVKLDTYTNISDNFKDSYDKGDTKEKVLLNINKWIQMLNNRDYSSAYKVLDETFRNNNFGNEDKFEEYMREKYPLHYSITFNEYNEENDVSIVAITLKDITNKDSTTKDLKIIMKLNENYDFVMSFEI